MIICVTGKAGSGKTTVSGMLRQHIRGSRIMDADAIGKGLLSDRKTMKRLTAAFGAGILKKGKIDRKLLAGAAFRSRKSQRALNSIMHPSLINKIKYETKSAEGTTRHCIIDAALFDELKLKRMSDFVVLVRANEAEAKKRVSAEIFLRRKFQKELRKPDFILYNNSGISSLKKSVKAVAGKILRAIAAKQRGQDDTAKHKAR